MASNNNKILVFLLVSSLGLAQSHPVSAQDDFDPFLVPVQDGPSTEELKLEKRHRILQVHQAIGYATLALVTTEVALGWANYGIFRKKGLTLTHDKIRKAHFGMGLVSWTSYMTGAGLARFTPKLEQKDSEGSIATHRRLAWVHGIGMGILPVWGYITSQKRNQLLDNPNRKDSTYNAVAAAHGAFGTVTWSALVGAYITVMLK